jgi:hypothetical protein
MAKFLADHNKVIDGLDFSKKERGPELRKPIRDARTHSAPELLKIQTKLGFELPPPLFKFLREVGSFWLYDFEICPIGNFAKEIKDFRSWIKEDPLTVKTKVSVSEPETLLSAELLPFAGFDLDRYLIHIENGKVYFWNHEEWSQAQFIGTFDAWLSRFLMERLQGVKSYYGK